MSEGTVLVVEDDPVVLEAVGAMITELGYTVHHANDSATALAALEDIDYVDVLLTDFVMSGGAHGDELARDVRKASPNTLVLFMSAYPQADLVSKGITSSTADVLRKPFQMETLEQALKALFKVGTMAC